MTTQSAIKRASLAWGGHVEVYVDGELVAETDQLWDIALKIGAVLQLKKDPPEEE